MRYALIAAAVIGAFPAHAQSFRSLLFHPGQDTAVGLHELRLEGPDRQDAPTVWEGPLRISTGKRSCEAHVSLVNAVWAAPEAKFAIVISQSGSSTFVQFIDVLSCAEKWPPVKAFTEDVKVLPNRIQIMPACACESPDAPCSCSAAQVYRIGGNRVPALLVGESRTLTRDRLGLDFVGTRKVLHPRTPQASLSPN